MLTKLLTDLYIISLLDDEPNDVGGMSSAELKAKFDEAANTIKTYINESLIPELAGTNGAESVGIDTVPGLTGVSTVQAALEKIEEQMAEMTQGAVADDSITTAKLAALAVTSAKLAAAAVETDKIKDGAVTSVKLAELAVTAARLADLAVETAKIKDKAVTTAKIADKAVTTAQLDALSVTAAKLAALAVDTAKIKDKAVTMAKLADHAVSVVKSVQLPTTGWTRNSDGVYEANVTLSGLKTTDTVILGLRRGTTDPDGWTLTPTAFDSDRETFSKILAGRITAANTLHLYAKETITNAIYLNCWVVSK